MFLLQFLDNPLVMLVFLASIIIAVTVHEFAHAWAADELGDPTARLLGRKSLDPRKHLDPMGSLLFLIAGFGWGKPVPVDTFNLKDDLKDNALIALAGPASNLLLAAVTGALFYFTKSFDILAILLYQFAHINVMLAVFNLLPVPPLDGSKIYRAVLPESFMPVWLFLDRYGAFILLFLFLTGSSIITRFLYPVINTIMHTFGFPIL
jgi:Zn-dependent protease